MSFFKDYSLTKEKSPYANIFLPEMKNMKVSPAEKEINTVIEFNRNKEKSLMNKTLMT
jgi:hypothetical protein